MKKHLYALSFLLLFLTGNLFAQSNRCGTTDYWAQQLATHPETIKSRLKAQEQIQSYLNAHPEQKIASTGPIVIPVIFHVVYKTAGQNVSLTQVQAQVDQLNADYARLNSDTTNTPAAFASLGANSNVQFCLAQRDPNCLPTNGIETRLTTVNSFTNDDVKHYATGGLDAWDASQYFNVWTCNLGGGLLGYATFPGGDPTLDGVVILYNTVGSIANPFPGGAPYNLGRTLTHESGHWLSLYHIWGDDGSACTGTDQVADTPNQASENYGCPSYPHVTCSNGPDGDMFMNYMDYTDDGCMNIFTLGQTQVMNGTLNGPRLSIQFSQACSVPVADDAGISSIPSPSGTICATSVSPIVELRNYGTTTLTSVTINYQIDAGTINTYAWTGSLAPCAVITVNLPVQAVSNGNHTFTSSTSSPNSGTDPVPSNDGTTTSFNIATTGLPSPVIEGFETVTYPPAGWSLNNPDNSTTWVKSTSGHHTGAASITIDNFNYAANGEMDEMITASYDLTTLTNPDITFWVAYQLYTDPNSNPNYSDTLEMLISTDCGATYTSLYKKFGTTLTTTTPTFSSNQFVPTASQWRKETVSLSTYATSNGAIFKFRNITDYENNLYLDDINIDNSVGINNLQAGEFLNISPNPSNGVFKINAQFNSAQQISIEILNAVGQVIVKKQFENISSLHLPVSLDKEAAGMYIVNIRTDHYVITRKLTIK